MKTELRPTLISA